MSLIIKSDEDKERTPHLAMTHNELQGGAANGRNISLLMKTAEMTEAIEKALEGLGLQGQDVVKASYYGQLRSVLQRAVSDQFGGHEDYGWGEWIYVEDFNDTTVVFCTEDGLFVTAYTLNSNGTVATLDDTATPVTAEVIYTESEGEILLSEDAKEKLEDGVYTLVKSCTQNPATVEHLKQMFEVQKSKVIAMNEEITKAVDAAVAVEKTAFAAQEILLKAALEELEIFKAAQKAAVEKARHTALSEVVPADKVEALLKAYASMDDEGFNLTVETLKLAKAAEAQNPLFKEEGVNGQGEQDSTKVDKVAEILKSKYPQKTEIK